MERKKLNPEEYEIIPVMINGKKYLTFPQTQIFTGMGREVLRQRMERKKIPFFSIKPNYLFVPYDVCVELKEGEVKDKKTEKLKELFTVEELNQLIKQKEKK
jgi:hypothetical protein